MGTPHPRSPQTGDTLPANTCFRYLASTTAMEHLLLAFFRAQDAETVGGAPTRLREWIAGYPGALGSSNPEYAGDVQAVCPRRNGCCWAGGPRRRKAVGQGEGYPRLKRCMNAYQYSQPPRNFEWSTMWEGTLSGGTNAFSAGMYNVIWFVNFFPVWCA